MDDSCNYKKSKRFVKDYWNRSWDSVLNQTHRLSESFRDINEFTTDALTETWVFLRLGPFWNIHQTHHKPCCPIGESMTLAIRFFIMSQKDLFSSIEITHEIGLNQTHIVGESFRAINKFTTDSLTEPWVFFWLGPFWNVHQKHRKLCYPIGEWMTLASWFFIMSQEDLWSTTEIAYKIVFWIRLVQSVNYSEPLMSSQLTPSLNSESLVNWVYFEMFTKHSTICAVKLANGWLLWTGSL